MKAAIVLFAVLCMPALASSDIIYVPDDYTTIQEAIDAAVDGDTVLVKPGTYVENIDFLGKAITVKSELGPDSTIIDGNQAGSVVTFQYMGWADAVLDGFTITNGSGTDMEPPFGYFYGGGIYCYFSSPTIMNNIICGNEVASHAGGILCYEHSAPTISNNVIANNSSFKGGGMCCIEYSFPLIINNVISDNTASDAAGGICIKYDAEPTIENNVIIGNRSRRGGGGISCAFASPIITKNVITGNSSDIGGGMSIYQTGYPIIGDNIISYNSARKGGGIYFYDSLTIANSIIFENSAVFGGGICCRSSELSLTNNTISSNSAKQGGGIWTERYDELIVANTILWKNTAAIGDAVFLGGSETPSTMTISYSDVEGGISSIHLEPQGVLNWGSGMIDSDPLFVDGTNSDFHLTFNSPCRGSGDNTAVTVLCDFEGDPRICQGTVDMGADECYRHLYCMGDFTPGGSIEGKLVGLPGTSPVGLFLGFGVLDPPLTTACGNFYLQPPVYLFPLAPIPGDGVLVLPATIPATPPAPYDLPMQALIGLEADSLSNLFVLEVR
jgi:parallel beta-helix repeat protein